MDSSKPKIHDMGRDDNGRNLVFHCPACGYGHPFRIEATSPGIPQWTWNGSYDRPTFTPSLMVGRDYPQMRCHSNVNDGRITYHADSFHAMKGHTVDLPDWDD